MKFTKEVKVLRKPSPIQIYGSNNSSPQGYWQGFKIEK